MKNGIKLLVIYFMCLLSRLYTYNHSQWLRSKFDLLYSMWISNFLGYVGERSWFSRPLLLQGGGQQRIKIGSHTHFGHHCVLGCWELYASSSGIDQYEPEIIIGNKCHFGEYCQISAINRITIGDGLLTGRFVYIGDNAHGGHSFEEAETPPILRRLSSKGEIIIGRNVWIADRVTILGGVTIGDNVIIGAGSVVSHDIPSNSVAVGAPAKIIKQIK